MPTLLPAAGGGRKPMPELVLPFQLPFADLRPDMPMLDNTSVQAAMAMGASETSSLDTGSDSDDYSVMSDDSDLDSEAEESRREARRRKREPATIEESLVLLQSLRQSRLSHLSSLLTPFSQRVKSGMIYPNVLPLSLLHGLNPRDPHILIQLGRADIHVGPHVFLKTKFWEVRPDYEMPPSMSPVGGIRAPGSYAGPSAYPRMPIPQSLPKHLPQPQPPKLPSPRAAPLPSLPQPKLPAVQLSAAFSHAEAGSLACSDPNDVSVSVHRTCADSGNDVGTSFVTRGQASSSVPPPPAIDAVLVSRVNATAALNPELQELLHIAASGKANPNQLKALGVWIQAITAQLRQDEARNAANANNAAASGSRNANAATTTAEGKKTKKTKVDEAAKASKKQAKIEEREAKKKAKAEAKAKAQADKQQARKSHTDKQHKVQHQQQHLRQQQQNPNLPLFSGKLRHPPPGWPTDGPPKPPVIIVEFRENPSMRFILPLWKCLVERTEGLERPSLPKIKKERRSFFDNDSDDEESQRIEPELKLSFFAPSLGSDAADGSGLRELEEELKRKAAEEAKLNAVNASSTASPSDGAALGASSSTASPEAGTPASATGDNDKADTHAKKKKAGSTTGSKKGSKAVKQEVPDAMSFDHPQSKKHEVYPLTWSIKGGVTESLWEAFGRVPGTMTCQPVKREPEIELEPDVAEFLVPEIRYHLLDLPMEEIKIQKETTEAFVDLYSQVPDRRFILPRVAPIHLPQGLEDHLQDRFAVRPQCIEGRPMVKRKAGAREDDVSFSYEGIGLAVIGPDGVKTEPGAEPAKPPKRKRHVATHNPDGSIKSCGACGKTKTPMWRRGPKGPSQLCNACGARWKAGRLVVPEVAPPPIIEAEEDKSKEEEARKEDEAQASMHGSNALVIPQSSGDDDSFSVMAASGLVGPDPFGDSFALASEGKSGMDFGSSHLSRGSSSPSPFIRSPVPEDHVMPASVDPSMLSGSMRGTSGRR
uniref:GATA-type domain-containing protein n=1 Tax=Kalmanozyma brasiliensis (strain GHG001) TaxID=1365824 RepID=V5EU54_KALBG